MNKSQIKKRILLLCLLVGLCLALGFLPSAKNTKAAAGNFILAWSTDTYTPLNYAGKALPVYGSQIKVEALPTRKLTPDPEKIYYRWLLDDQVAGGAAGQGKSVFDFLVRRGAGDFHTIELQILNENWDVIDRYATAIKIINPEIMLYKTDESYSQEGEIKAKTNQEVKLTSKPFFFNIKNAAELELQWRINDQLVQEASPESPSILSLKTPDADLKEPLFYGLSLLAASKKEPLQRTYSKWVVKVQ